MLGKRIILLSVGLIVLAGAFAALSYDTDTAYGQTIGDDQFDLAAELEKAVSGDTITLTKDALLSASANVKSGVTLDDGGFSLTIPAGIILSIEGVFNSSGNLVVRGDTSVTVASGGVLSIDDKGEADIIGSLEVFYGGTLNVGLTESSTLGCGGNGRLLVEGKMVVGTTSSVDVRNAVVTGTLEIAAGSTFLLRDIMTVGHAPIHTIDAVSGTVTGKVTLSDRPAACVVVYKNAGFDETNIKSAASSTKFILSGIVGDNVYYTEYQNRSGNRALVFPSVEGLKDYSITDWKDTSGNVVTPEMGKTIGSYAVLESEMSRKNYNITLAEDRSIRWMVGGIIMGSSEVVKATYDTPYTVSVISPSGGELPTLYKDGVAQPGTSVSFRVTEDTTFTTSNHYLPGGSKVSALTIVLSIVIVILLIVVAVLLMKYKEKTKK